MAMAESDPHQLNLGSGLGYRNAYGLGAVGAWPYTYGNTIARPSSVAAAAPIAAASAGYPNVYGIGSLGALPYTHGATFGRLAPVAPAATTAAVSAAYPNTYGLGALGAVPYIHRTPSVHAAPVDHSAATTDAVISTYANTYGPGGLGDVRYVQRPSGYAAPVAPATQFTAAPDAVPHLTYGAINALPSTPTTIQFHSQDEVGNYEYGYNNPNSAQHVVGNSNIGVQGYYTAKDIHGDRTINYVADALGFRVVGGSGRKKRSIHAAPGIVPSALASRDAIRMNIQYNPGHAWGYIVY